MSHNAYGYTAETLSLAVRIDEEFSACVRLLGNPAYSSTCTDLAAQFSAVTGRKLSSIYDAVNVARAMIYRVGEDAARSAHEEFKSEAKSARQE